MPAGDYAGAIYWTGAFGSLKASGRFFEKKLRKKLLSRGYRRWQQHVRKTNKSFLLELFFKKATASFDSTFS
jgi:hypothetical protein